MAGITNADLNREIGEMKVAGTAQEGRITEMKSELHALRGEMKREIDELRREVRDGFRELRDLIEPLQVSRHQKAGSWKVVASIWGFGGAFLTAIIAALIEAFAKR